MRRYWKEKFFFVRPELSSSLNFSYYITISIIFVVIKYIVSNIGKCFLDYFLYRYMEIFLCVLRSHKLHLFVFRMEQVDKKQFVEFIDNYPNYYKFCCNGGGVVYEIIRWYSLRSIFLLIMVENFIKRIINENIEK